MKRVELTAEAELDAFEIAHYYEQERAGLGYRFEGDLGWILDRIGQNALQFPVVDEGTRRALLRNFPYGVFFSDEPNMVVVAAIVHLHREPGSWRRSPPKKAG